MTDPWFAFLEKRFAEAMTAAQEQRERMPEQGEFWRGREGAFYDAMAWLDDAANATRTRRAELEAARRERKHVVERGEIGFTYRPTPPSGPPPKSDSGERT